VVRCFDFTGAAEAEERAQAGRAARAARRRGRQARTEPKPKAERARCWRADDDSDDSGGEQGGARPAPAEPGSGARRGRTGGSPDASGDDAGAAEAASGGDACSGRREGQGRAPAGDGGSAPVSAHDRAERGQAAAQREPSPLSMRLPPGRPQLASRSLPAALEAWSAAAPDEHGGGGLVALHAGPRPARLVSRAGPGARVGLARPLGADGGAEGTRGSEPPGRGSWGGDRASAGAGAQGGVHAGTRGHGEGDGATPRSQSEHHERAGRESGGDPALAQAPGARLLDSPPRRQGSPQLGEVQEGAVCSVPIAGLRLRMQQEGGPPQALGEAAGGASRGTRIAGQGLSAQRGAPQQSADEAEEGAPCDWPAAEQAPGAQQQGEPQSLRRSAQQPRRAGGACRAAGGAGMQTWAIVRPRPVPASGPGRGPSPTG
jgi:hypothetical protein